MATLIKIEVVFSLFYAHISTYFKNLFLSNSPDISFHQLACLFLFTTFSLWVPHIFPINIFLSGKTFVIEIYVWFRLLLAWLDEADRFEGLFNIALLNVFVLIFCFPLYTNIWSFWHFIR